MRKFKVVWNNPDGASFAEQFDEHQLAREIRSRFKELADIDELIDMARGLDHEIEELPD